MLQTQKFLSRGFLFSFFFNLFLCFYREAGDTLEQVAQRVCGIFIPEAFQNSAGQVPEQPDLTGCLTT